MTRDGSAATARRRLARLLSDQARHCAALGSSLYGVLLERAAADAAAGGPTWQLLAEVAAPGPRGDALALRLMTAVHRLALSGRAPALADRLPSTRKVPRAVDDLDKTWIVLRDLIAERADELRPLVSLPCQTNEVVALRRWCSASSPPPPRGCPCVCWSWAPAPA